MRSVGLSDTLHDYALAHANPAGDHVAERLAAVTRERFGDLGGMNIGLDQGRFLQMLVEVTGATTVVEVGTFTGMSALWLARGLGVGGRLLCFELSADYHETANDAWMDAGVADRIDLRFGPAAAGLAALPERPHVDLAFIDADKDGYATYLDLLMPRMNERGLIIVDNVLWSGRVVDVADQEPNTRAIRDFNDQVATRDDCTAVVLPIGDGITLIRPRPRP